MIAAAVGALAGGAFGTVLVAAWRFSRRQARPPSRSPRMTMPGRQAEAPTIGPPPAWSPPLPVERPDPPARTRVWPNPSSAVPAFGSHSAAVQEPGIGGRVAFGMPPRAPAEPSHGPGRPAPVWDAAASATGRGSTTGKVAGGAVTVAASVGAALAAGVRAAVLLLTVGVGVPLVVRASRRRSASRLQAARASAAPAVIDLLGACLLAGLNPYRSLLRVAERGPEVLRAELAQAAVDLDMGRTPAAALRGVAERTGLDELRAAAGALQAAERWGAPPAEALAARAEALRSRARLRAEADAGRAAVRLAFPLVFCFLPAFVLLVVVPTTVGALRALAP